MNLLERQMWPYLSPVWGSSVILRMKSKLLTKGNKDGAQPGPVGLHQPHTIDPLCNKPPDCTLVSLSVVPFHMLEFLFFSFFAGLPLIIQDSAYLSLIPESLPEPLCSSLLPQLLGSLIQELIICMHGKWLFKSPASIFSFLRNLHAVLNGCTNLHSH